MHSLCALWSEHGEEPSRRYFGLRRATKAHEIYCGECQRVRGRGERRKQRFIIDIPKNIFAVVFPSRSRALYAWEASSVPLPKLRVPEWVPSNNATFSYSTNSNLEML